MNKLVFGGLVIFTLGLVAFSVYKYISKLNKKKELEDYRWIGFNRFLIGKNRKDLVKILGEGTRLEENSIFYLIEPEKVGRVQNLYYLDEKERIVEVSLLIKNKKCKDEILDYMNTEFFQEEDQDLGLFSWSDGEVEYILKEEGRILELSLKKIERAS